MTGHRQKWDMDQGLRDADALRSSLTPDVRWDGRGQATGQHVQKHVLEILSTCIYILTGIKFC